MISTLMIRVKLRRYVETGDLQLAAELLTHIPMLCETVDIQRDAMREMNDVVIPALQREIAATQAVIDELKSSPMVAR